MVKARQGKEGGSSRRNTVSWHLTAENGQRAKISVSSQVKSEEMCQFNRGFVTEKYFLVFRNAQKSERPSKISAVVVLADFV